MKPITKEETKALFDSRVDSYGRDLVLEHIDENKGIAATVVTSWLESWRSPSSSVQRDIFFCLKNMLPSDFPKIAAVPVIPKPQPVAEKPRSPLTRRTANIRHNDSVLEKMTENLRRNKVIS